jgi:hypothetical protein
MTSLAEILEEAGHKPGDPMPTVVEIFDGFMAAAAIAVELGVITPATKKFLILLAAKETNRRFYSRLTDAEKDRCQELADATAARMEANKQKEVSR